MTGHPADAALRHVVNRLVPDTTVATAAHAGALRMRTEHLRRKKRDLTVDAIVAATAVALAPSVIITGDPADLSALITDADVHIVSL